MPDFVDIPFTTTKSDFEDIAMEAYAASVPGWVGEDGDPEVINIETISPLAVNLGNLLASMPKAALIAFGTKLLGLSYGAGQSAFTNVIFTVQDVNGPYTIPAFNGIVIDGFGFILTADVVVPNGSTTAIGLVASTARTADANGLVGTNIDPVAMPSFVTGYALVSPTIGGADAQSDDDFADQVSRDRRLNSRALVVPLDFELEALDNQGITRANATVTGVNALLLTVLGVGGAPATTAAKAGVAADIATIDTVNVVVTIADPVFNVIGLTYSVQIESGFDPADAITRANAAVMGELSPLTHGVPESGDPGNAITTWINDPFIYLNRMIQVIGNTNGVHRVVTIALNGTLQAKLSSPIAATTAITSIPLLTTAGNNLLNTIPSGAVVTLKDTATGNTDSWTTSSVTNPSASSIAVVSHGPVHAYPTATTVISSVVTGDFAMSGTVPVPQAGTISGTAV